MYIIYFMYQTLRTDLTEFTVYGVGKTLETTVGLQHKRTNRKCLGITISYNNGTVHHQIK